MKMLFDLIMFAGIGGPISLVGGFIGFYFGTQAYQDCSQECFSSTYVQGCLAACRDPWQYAVYLALPGVGIAIIQQIIKSVNKSAQ